MINKRDRKKFLVMLALVIAISGCGGGKKAADSKKTDVEATANIETENDDKKVLADNTYATLQDGVYTATGGALQFKVSDDWSLSEEDATVLVYGDPKNSKDCLAVQYTDKDEEFANYSLEDFDKYYGSIFDNYQGVSYEKAKVAGLNAGCLEYTFSTDVADVTAYQYFIDGEDTYLLTFMDVSGKLKDQVATVLESVEIPQ